MEEDTNVEKPVPKDETEISSSDIPKSSTSENCVDQIEIPESSTTDTCVDQILVNCERRQPLPWDITEPPLLAARDSSEFSSNCFLKGCLWYKNLLVVFKRLLLFFFLLVILSF